ncbi:MAG: hypothetical protein ACR2QH_12005 [Geminicoccaceae bacterium]
MTTSSAHRALPLTIGILIATCSAGLADTKAETWLDNLEFSGSIAGEARWFVEDPQFEGQLSGVQPSIAIEPEVDWASEEGAYQARFVPFLRLDGRDSERTHGDVREAYLRYIANDWEALVGVNRVFWGVTESRHLVNIINQIDGVENIDEEDFLGEPMINLALQRDYGLFSVFVLPGFRERTFAGEDGRLRTPLPVDWDAAEYESGAEQWSTDVALRYSHFFDEWDVGASYFHGTSREARLVLSDDATQFEPRYDQIHQFGLDLQYTKDAWLWKFEGIAREGQGTFGAFVGGFEYTFYQINETDADLGVLSEYLYDGRDNDKAPPTAFDNDLFLGARLTLNDINDTAALVGTVVDLETQTASFRLEAERRIGDSRKIELESQWFTNVDNDDVLAAARDDSYLLLRFSQFF